MKIKIILCFIIGLCWACKEKDYTYKDLKIIKGYDEEVQANGTGIEVDSFQVVPLETNSSSILSGINRVAFMDSLIFIHSNDRLLCFNNAGKFLYPVGIKGRGAGEYLRINTFFTDNFHQTINIVDEFSGKILTYKPDGTYLNEKKYPPRSFYMLHTGYLVGKDKLLCSNYVYKRFNRIYSLIDLPAGTTKELGKFPLQTQNTAMPIGQETIATYKDSIKVILPFDNKLYSYADSTLVPLILIETEKKFLSERKLKAEKDFSVMTYFNADQKGYFSGFKAIFETENYILLNEAGNNQYFLIDKKKNTGKRYTYSNDGKLNRLPLTGIFTINKNYFVGTISAYALKDLTKHIPEPIPDQNLKKLKEISTTIEEGDNPCLLFYKLKTK